MWDNAHDAYLESRILSADPLELVRLTYRGAMGVVREAREHLANGRIMERAKAISKASEILLELMASLDHGRGQEISRHLSSLYEYMLQRLIDANFKQQDEPLAEVLGLLATLLEGWDGISLPQETTTAPSANPWAPPLSQETVPASVTHAWSF